MTNEETATIKWILNHPLWTHSYFARIPPANTNPFIRNDRGTLTLADDSNWPEQDIRDGCFSDVVTTEYVFVNPASMTIDDDESLNTLFQVWIEAGGWCDQSAGGWDDWMPETGWNEFNKWIPEHDYRLNCSGDNVVAALLNLAKLVAEHYNDDGTSKDD